MSEAQALTYGELNRRANQLAHFLRGLGVRPETVVGICLERSAEMVVCLLGVWKAGGVCLPLDPREPEGRLAFFLADARASVLLTHQRFARAFSTRTVRTVCTDTERHLIEQQRSDNPVNEATSHNLAYIFYTSGSTGQPKGVGLEHLGIVNEVAWTQRYFNVVPADRASWISAPAFAISRWELWSYVTAGASIHIVPQAIAADPPELRNWLIRKQITIGFLITSLAEQMYTFDWPADVALRVLITGGEPCRRWPSPSLPFTVVVSYGITETSSVRTVFRTDSALSNRDSSPPIGRPIANTRVYVLDAALEPAPVGVRGELYIGGEGLARGYVGRPELTAQRFLPDPFSAALGARMYRTGDLARYLPDGNIEFLGRADHQVKVRGVRIEPGEIEALLNRHPAVGEALVLVHTDAVGEQRLVGYVAARPGESVAAGPLRRWLQEQLPQALIPTAFVLLDAMPRLRNGKLDRQALLAREIVQQHETYVAPRNPVEARLAAIWAELFRVEQVGVHDDFFELGGHSLLAVKMLSRVRDAFRLQVTEARFFERPTVADLAAAIAETPSRQRDGDASAIERVHRDRIDHLMERVNRLSDDELALLLSTPDGTD
ncbi:MAG: non-ribosomal peptide synthetase [Candidatus Eremiobacteraeota bacterium]|nr:non-ribosomal peptide synthetase [Candidatus Eremiobacteraeota bacterium]